MKVTIGGQIDLFMLIEDFWIAGFKITSANTDGMECLVPINRVQEYYKICKQWEEEVGNSDLGNLEFVEYEMFVQTSVNDYLAVKKADWIYEDGLFQAKTIDKPLQKRIKKKGEESPLSIVI